MKRKLSQFLCETSGNISIMAAFMLPLLLMGSGIALTVIEADDRSNHLQNHADNMSLTLAKTKSSDNHRDVWKYFRQYKKSQLLDSEDCSYEINRLTADNVTEITVTCSGEIDTFLSGFMDKRSVPYNVSSTATVATSKAYEVSFIYDISESMVGDEIDDLKTTLVSLTESDLFDDDDSRISLIPFANTVRLDDRFETYVTPGSGYDEAEGVYNGCFDREMTDPDLELNSSLSLPLVKSELSSGKVVCPHESMTAIFHKEADDWEVKDLKANIDISFGTGMSDALVWGFRSLDPSLRGVLSAESQYPMDSSDGVSKHLIMMTDGKPYNRPWSGGGGGAVTQALSLEKFKEACDALDFAGKDINFHLINYNNSGLSDETIEVFEDCVSGEGEFHDVASGELSTVIGEIATQASSLRISR